MEELRVSHPVALLEQPGGLQAYHAPGELCLIGDADMATGDIFRAAVSVAFGSPRDSPVLVDLTRLSFLSTGCARDLLLLVEQAGHDRPPGADGYGRSRMSGAALIQFRFTLADLPKLRLRIGDTARLAGLDEDRCEELVLAAYELAGNAIRHGGGDGNLLMSCVDGVLRCQVSDDGPGFACAAEAFGDGLGLARQLTDGIEIDRGAGGGVVTLIVLSRPSSQLSGNR
jgi:anti-sigma regulatory factor (Ser/Thr protein kinase)